MEVYPKEEITMRYLPALLCLLVAPLAAMTVYEDTVVVIRHGPPTLACGGSTVVYQPAACHRRGVIRAPDPVLYRHQPVRHVVHAPPPPPPVVVHPPVYHPPVYHPPIYHPPVAHPPVCHPPVIRVLPPVPAIRYHRHRRCRRPCRHPFHGPVLGVGVHLPFLHLRVGI